MPRYTALLLCCLSIIGCGVSIPEGRFACESDNDCPGDFVCRLDGLCYSTPGASLCTPVGITCESINAECGSVGIGCDQMLNCGDCSDEGPNHVCTGNVCTCTTSAAACAGVECGLVPDGCGGMVDCGTSNCPAGYECDLNNECACAPTSCNEQGWECGNPSNGCGDLLICNAGASCSMGESCGGGGVSFECGSGSGCVPPSCSFNSCGDLPNPCGGGPVHCGDTCDLPQTCGGGGTLNQCGCTSKTCGQLLADAGVTCGSFQDGCGNQINCGCGNNETCDTQADACVCNDSCAEIGSAACGTITGCSAESCGLCGQPDGTCNTGTNTCECSADEYESNNSSANATDLSSRSVDGKPACSYNSFGLQCKLPVPATLSSDSDRDYYDLDGYNTLPRRTGVMLQGLDSNADEYELRVRLTCAGITTECRSTGSIGGACRIVYEDPASVVLSVSCATKPRLEIEVRNTAWHGRCGGYQIGIIGETSGGSSNVFSKLCSLLGVSDCPNPQVP